MFAATQLQAQDPPTAQHWIDELNCEGYCVIPDIVAKSLVSEMRDDLGERFRLTPFCEGDFYGTRTKRFGGLLKRSRHAEALVRHPLVMEIAQTVLGPHCDTIQLNLTQGVEIHPGSPRQAQHRDQDMWGGPKGSIEYLLNVMWPLSPFTTENGATLVWPRSHLDQQNYFPDLDDAIAAEMEPGSALIFLGSTLHCGCANISNAPRTGLIISYCLGWLRPFENQMLVYPPDLARAFSPDLAALVGYSLHRPNLGNYEGQCPSILLGSAPKDHLPAKDALRPEQQAYIAQLKRESAA